MNTLKWLLIVLFGGLGFSLSVFVFLKVLCFFSVGEQLVEKWVRGWRQYPICLLGYDIRRWEGKENEIIINDYYKRLIYTTNSVHYGPTHIQYQSPFGFLLTWPLCFHFWYQWKMQAANEPGTEKLIYGRIGARWDCGAMTYIVPSAFLGLHWD